MQRMMEKLLDSYGRDLELCRGDVRYRIRGILQPVTGRSESWIQVSNSPLGRVEDGRYLYIGPVEPQAMPEDLLLCEGACFVLRRCQCVEGFDGPAYCWGMCVRKGGEDTWGRNG